MAFYGKYMRYTENNKIDHDHVLPIPDGKWHGIIWIHMVKMASAKPALSHDWICSKTIAVL